VEAGGRRGGDYKKIRGGKNPLPYPHWVKEKGKRGFERYGTNIEYKIFYSVFLITKGVLT